MPWFDKKCASCGKEIYVPFKKKDGRMSRALRIERGAVCLTMHIKEATHSSVVDGYRKTYCCQCAADALVAQFYEVQSKLLDPAGEDPPRVVKTNKAGPRRARERWQLHCQGCGDVFWTRTTYLPHIARCVFYRERRADALVKIVARRKKRPSLAHLTSDDMQIADGIDELVSLSRHRPESHIIMQADIDLEISAMFGVGPVRRRVVTRFNEEGDVWIDGVDVGAPIRPVPPPTTVEPGGHVYGPLDPPGDGIP